jgi:hypothetical protein
MDDDSLTISPPIYMVGMKIGCWRCGERMPVVAFLAPSVEGADDQVVVLCLASSPLAVWRQTSWPVRVVAGLAVVACDNVGPAIGKLPLRGSKAFGVTGFL